MQNIRKWVERSLRRLGYAGWAMVASAALAGCGGPALDTAPSAAGEHLYQSLFPYYAELCAVSELKKKPGFGVEVSSGIGGHSTLYLNGVCRDRRAGYPRLRLCDPNDTEDGVGISVNAHFDNVNWVATPGHDFFYHGDLAPGERLTRAAYERTQARAKSLGILDGVRFHSEALAGRPAGMSAEDYLYEISVATDYAIGFGRDRYCARVPLDRQEMTRVVRYLDDLNARYALGGEHFAWDVLNNNCAHVTHNALAAAGVWDFWQTGQFALFAAFDFPVPKNEFVNLMRRTNDMPLDDPDKIVADPQVRQALLRNESLPMRPGALAEAERAWRDNDVYDTDLSLIFYENPLIGTYRHRFVRIFSEPRYLDLGANLRYFARLYASARLREEEEPPPHDRDTASLRALYQRYIERAGGAIEGELAAFERASGRFTGVVSR